MRSFSTLVNREVRSWIDEDPESPISPFIEGDLKHAKKVSVSCWTDTIFNLPEGRLAAWAKEIDNLNWFEDKTIRTSLAAYCSAYNEVERCAPFAQLTNRIIKLARGTLTGVANTYPVNDFCFVEYNRPVDTIKEHEGLGATRKPGILGLRNAAAKKLRGRNGEEQGQQLKVQWTDILLPLELCFSTSFLESFNLERQKRGLDVVDSQGAPVKPLVNAKKSAKKPSGRSVNSARADVSRSAQAKITSSAEVDILASFHEWGEYPCAGAAETDTLAGVTAAVQAASYALELLSCTYGTRLFCLSAILNDATISLWYYDASGVVYSTDCVSVVNNFEMFAAIIVGLACCTPGQFGVLPTDVVRPRISYPRKFPPITLGGNTLTISDCTTKAQVNVTLDQPVFSQHILIGRRTFMYTVEMDPVICEKKLIMKLSYQIPSRKDEYKLMDIAKKAKVQHLPNIHLWGDLWKLSDGVRDIFLRKSEHQATYEDRVLRAVVYPRYSSIKALFADNCLLITVMVDQMLDCLHDLWYKANILHRDITVDSIMYEKRGDDYHFVLIDFDMAVELPKDGSTLAASSKHRTGTLPFMAYELIEDANQATRGPTASKWMPRQHRLCHDFESLFWVCVWCVLMLFRHRLDKEEKDALLSFLKEWESGTLSQIAAIKFRASMFPLNKFRIQLPGPTIALHSWLSAWLDVFMNAINTQRKHEREINLAEVTGQTVEPFDEETIGGTFTRQTLKDALTPFMPFKQDAIIIDEIETDDVEVEKDDVEVEKDDTGPTENDVPRDKELPQVIAKDKPRRQARKRARPQEQEVAAENDIRARLRPRRKVVYKA